MKRCQRCINGVMFREHGGYSCLNCGVFLADVIPMDIPEGPGRRTRRDALPDKKRYQEPSHKGVKI